MAEPKPDPFRPSMSTNQKAYLRDNYLERWRALLELDVSLAKEQEFKEGVVLACIGTAEKKTPTLALFSPLIEDDSDVPYPKAHHGWKKVILVTLSAGQ
jgi:hypothetical protein